MSFKFRRGGRKVSESQFFNGMVRDIRQKAERDQMRVLVEHILRKHSHPSDCIAQSPIARKC